MAEEEIKTEKQYTHLRHVEDKIKIVLNSKGTYTVKVNGIRMYHADTFEVANKWATDNYPHND